jgi:tetratricopeptide (TPR) repeat protein
LISSDRASEASLHLETAERLLGAHPEQSDLAALRHEEARRAVRLGQADDAVSRASETLELLGEANPVEQGSALLAMAQGLTLSGKVEEADAAFRQAVELLERHGQRQDLGEALRSWGKLLRSTGREKEALDILERAAELGAPSAPAGAPRPR